MICKISKRDLKVEAERLGAERISRLNNIYAYEEARYQECKKLDATYEGVAYSGGTYGNTGRLDKITGKNGETIKYTFYA